MVHQIPTPCNGISDSLALKQCTGFPQTSQNFLGSQISFNDTLDFCIYRFSYILHMKGDAALSWQQNTMKNITTTTPGNTSRPFSTQRLVLIAMVTAITCILAPFSIPIPISPVPISLTNLVLCTRLERRHRQFPYLSTDWRRRFAGLLRFCRGAWQNRRTYRGISGGVHLYDHHRRNIRRAF